jgi:hypothetical protein
MAVSCDPYSLMESAKCMDCIPPSMQLPVMIWLLATMGGLSTDPYVLMANAKDFQSLSPATQQDIMIYLTCAAATAAGA